MRRLSEEPERPRDFEPVTAVGRRRAAPSRPALVVAALLVVAVAAYAYFMRSAGGGAERYVTAPVSRGPIVSSVTATGTVNPVNTVQVGTYVSGPIRAVDVDYNSEVKRGQRVAKIDPATFLVKVKQAEANVANARARVEKDRADLELKQLTLDRTRQLGREKLVSQSEIDTARTNGDQAVAQIALDQAAVQQAEAELEEARVSLAYTDIVSPVDGVVVSRNVSVGQTVAASFQTPTLFLIAEDLTKMQVDANVSESDIGDVKEGQRASFTVDAYPGREFVGRVAQVRNAPISVQNVVTYDVVVAVDNADLALKPGMTATIGITTAEQQDVLRVPARALRFHPAGAPEEPAGRGADARPAVWSLDESGELRKSTIETGARNDTWVEVRSGLREGDHVVVATRAADRASATPARPPGFGGGPGYRHR